MPLRDEEAFKHERAAFDADMLAARQALDAGDFPQAVDLLVSPAHKYSYGKLQVRFDLLAELYSKLDFPFGGYPEKSWKGKLMAELYALWPKVSLDAVFIKHSFPEPHTDEWSVSGAEQAQFSEYAVGLLGKKLGVLSRGRYWLKFWDVETGEVIHAQEEALPLLASFIDRYGSRVLFAQSFTLRKIDGYPETDSEEGNLAWTTNLRETFRRVPTGGGSPYLASPDLGVRYYKIKGEIVSVDRGETVELDRQSYEKNPVIGEKLRPREFKPMTPRLREYLGEIHGEQVEEVLQERAREIQKEKEIVRVKKPQTLTLEHGEIKGYLPAGTTTFAAEDGFFDFEPKVSDLWSRSGPITATVGVLGDEAWLQNIIVPGHGLRGMYSYSATTPITAVCISSDGSLAVRNGNGDSFGIWNLGTGDCLRRFDGHTDRVTCLDLSVDVGFAVSGSEDRTVRIWKPITSECVRVLAGHEDVVTQARISLDASRILSADRSGVMKLWDVNTGVCVRTIEAHTNSISGLCLTLDGKFGASCSWDKTVKLWDLSDGSCIRTLKHEDWVTSIDMTPDGRFLVSSSYSETIVWELVWQLEPRQVVPWDERARPYLEILMNANAAWVGKLGTQVDMTQEEIKDSLRRGCPSWSAWHSPSHKEDWYRVWHLNWDIDLTLGHAGYGWLSEVGEESRKHQGEWERQNPRESEG